MQLNKLSAGIACTRSTGLDDRTRQSATTHSRQHGDAPHNVGLPRRNAFVHVACRQHWDLCVSHALKLFGKHARATGKLAVYIERHMNAVRILVDSVELILVALLVHKNDAAHQRRVIKASRLKLNIHGCPFIQCER